MIIETAVLLCGIGNKFINIERIENKKIDVEHARKLFIFSEFINCLQQQQKLPNRWIIEYILIGFNTVRNVKFLEHPRNGKCVFIIPIEYGNFFGFIFLLYKSFYFFGNTVQFRIG